MTLAMVFPGQGSQSKGMLAELAAEHAEVSETFAEASDVLGFDLWDLVQNGPEEKLNETVCTQPAMLTADVAIFGIWRKLGGKSPSQMSGHSLGEYAALVCAGAIGFADCVAIVKRRAELMRDAVPNGEGAMAAILGLEDDAVINVCAQASVYGIAETANFNSPGQVVVAGQRVAIENLIGLAKQAGARRAIMLAVSVPAHSTLMDPAGEALADALQAVAFSMPHIPVVSAADATPYLSAEDIRERLTKQVSSPVRWVETVRYMIENGADSIVECGPGKVLAGLVRRIDRSVPVACIESPDALNARLAEEA